MDYFVGVGHGRRPDGTYDPGAVYGDLTEHVLAHAVVDGIATGLTRSGLAIFAEQDAGAGHDPNWSGSAATANHLRTRRALEVHFNASATHRASGAEAFHWPGNAHGASLAGALAGACAHLLGIPDRGPKDGSHLGFLRHTNMTAVLLEVAFIDHPGDGAAVRAADLHALGDDLAHHLALHLGRAYQSPTPPPDPDEEDDMTPEQRQALEELVMIRRKLAAMRPPSSLGSLEYLVRLARALRHATTSTD